MYRTAPAQRSHRSGTELQRQCQFYRPFNDQGLANTKVVPLAAPPDSRPGHILHNLTQRPHSPHVLRPTRRVIRQPSQPDRCLSQHGIRHPETSVPTRPGPHPHRWDLNPPLVSPAGLGTAARSLLAFFYLSGRFTVVRFRACVAGFRGISSLRCGIPRPCTLALPLSIDFSCQTGKKIS